ncbi:basement membrane-specific heparan sulfate proteoglycan core protein-like [Anabas testudineus]|uniref:basement membrane-specific heparan sulfate proteoglycan core protein-like n=1 Tax=Anabas testudineus TaxID=64144 RepID=UPI00143DD10D|nr:basement membrane-specific heparan sulfate proteoglycan core protein-like [Anabas testudineus]
MSTFGTLCISASDTTKFHHRLYRSSLCPDVSQIGVWTQKHNLKQAGDRVTVSVLDVKMKNTLFCVLLLFFLTTNVNGNNGEQDDEAESEKSLSTSVDRLPKATLTEDSTTIPAGGSVTLSCSVLQESADFKYNWFRRSSDSSQVQTLNVSESARVKVSQGGNYSCRGLRGTETDSETAESDPIIIQETVSIRPTVTLDPNWSLIYTGETITVRCWIQNHERTQWTYEWRPTNLNTYPTQSEYRIDRAAESHSGDYSCRGRGDYLLTEWSRVIKLTVSPNRPRASLRADSGVIPAGGRVTLSCSVDESEGWKYWFRRNSGSWSSENRVSEGGVYYCRGGRGNPVYYTENSNEVTINKTVSIRPTVTLDPNWSLIYTGETITVRCWIQNHERTHWTYEWRPTNLNTYPTQSEYRIYRAAESHSGDYSCRGRGDYWLTEWSRVIKLTVSHKPKAKLTTTIIPVGGRVTLSCSVDDSDGWKYDWFRRTSNSNEAQVVGEENRDIRVSQGGIYRCRGRRGKPVYYTDYSDEVTVEITVSVTQHWSQIFSGQKITVRCEIQGGGDTEWDYEWKTPQSTSHQTHVNYWILSVSESSSGNYMCRGRNRRDSYSSTVLTLEPNWSSFFTGESVTFICDMMEGKDTDWEYRWNKDGREFVQYNSHKRFTLHRLSTVSSGRYQCSGFHSSSNHIKTSNIISLTVSAIPKVKVTAGPTIIPVGGRVTLSCSVDDSDGWKYDWFRRTSNSNEAQVVGEENRDIRVSQGGIYRCIGRRGKPVYYTYYSDEVTVEITVSTSVSVTLQPDWSQIFSGETITVRCEIQGGGDTEWDYEWKTPQSTSHQTHVNYWTLSVSESSSGNYMCRGRNRRDSYSSTQWSKTITLTVSGAVLTLEPNWSSFFTGESVTFICDMKEGKDTEWEYRWNKDGGEFVQYNSHKRFTLHRLSTVSRGQYQCSGFHSSSNHIKTSNIISLTVSDKPKAKVTAGPTIIPAGGRVTLSCSVDESEGWKYWFRRYSGSWSSWNRVSEGGVYYCTGGRGNPVYYTENSNEVTIMKTVSIRPTVTLDPNWSLIYTGETITVRCWIQNHERTQWTYEWRPTNLNTYPTQSEYRIYRAAESHSGDYSCRGRGDYLLTKWSRVIKLTVSPNRPRASLRADSEVIPAGGRVTLSCSVDESEGWKYWFRHNSGSWSSENRVSEGGVYYCTGERGNPVYYTENSNEVTINKTVSIRPTVTLDPNWSLIYTGETITVRCWIQNHERTQWTYEWRPTNLNTYPTQSEYRIYRAAESHSGDYSCWGRGDYLLTEWSRVIKLTVSPNRPRASLRADSEVIPAGGRVTLSCSVDESEGWKYWFRRNSGSWSSENRVSEGGVYYCRGGRGNPVYYTENSNEVTINKTVSIRPTVTLDPNWSLIYTGETISVRCWIQNHERTQWTYEWRPTNLNTYPTQSEYRIYRAAESHSGDYSCRGRGDYLLTEWSRVIKLTVSPNRPRASLRADSEVIPAGGRVTLSCSGDESEGWKYWFRRNSGSWSSENRVSEGGVYYCRGGRGNPVYYTENSNEVTINKTVSIRPTVTLDPNWSLIYTGETITVRCWIQNHERTQWTYEWRPTNLNTYPTQSEYRIDRAAESHSGDYSCWGRGDYLLTEWSRVIKLTVSPNRPRASLRADSEVIPAGGRVTLSCSVDESEGWKYWFRHNSGSWSSENRVSEGGVYYCRGGRGNPVYYTENSNEVTIIKTVSIRPTVTLDPNWSLIYTGETISVRCWIQNHERTQWTYEWRPTNLNTYPTQSEYRIDRAAESHSGDYSCRGRGDYLLTEWSRVIKLTVSPTKPEAELNADIKVIPVGGSVTLSCSVNPSSGWKYYWYRGDQSSELLIRHDDVFKSNGQISVSKEGQYWCRGGRGEPVYYSQYSQSVRINTLDKPKAKLTAGSTIIPVGGRVTLSCSVDDSDGWKYDWFRRTSNSNEARVVGEENRDIRVSQGGIYRCRGRRGKPVYYTDYSDEVTVEITVSTSVSVTLQPGWSQIFSGEKITVRCEIQGGDTEWDYEWKTPQSTSHQTHVNYWTLSVSESSSGNYMCRGRNRRDSYSSTQWSKTFTLTESTDKPKAKVTAGPTIIPVGGRVTLSCSVDDSDGWKYDWFRRTSNSNEAQVVGEENRDIRVSQGGIYRCRGRRGEPVYYTDYSDEVTVEITVSTSVSVTLQPDWSQIFSGEKITVRCEIQGGGDTEWDYEWKTPQSTSHQTHVNYWTLSVSESSSGNYMCRGRNRRDSYSSTQWSKTITLTVSVSTSVSVTLQPDWSQIFSGEKITVRCEIQGGGDTEWDYEWKTPQSTSHQTHVNYWTLSVFESSSGNYMCRGRNRRDSYSSTQWSKTITLTVSEKPKPQLGADDRIIPVGGSVTLSCSVNPSSGWKYYWYRGDQSSELLIRHDDVFKSNGQISVSQEGQYWCRGGRGEPVYYSQYSQSVRINTLVTDSNRVVVTLHPNWSEIYHGEMITVRCEIQGGDTEWEYEWKTTSSIKPSNQNEFSISSASSSHSGNYRCKGRMKNAQYKTTEWSDFIKLTVNNIDITC